MKRRTILLAATCGLSVIGGGCYSDNGDGCPDIRGVDTELKNELPYEEYDLEEFDRTFVGIYLISGPEEIDIYTDEDVLTDEDQQWMDETDFAESVILGLQVNSSIESSDLKIHGIDREEGQNEETFRVYSCIAHPGETDDSTIYSRLLRVPHRGSPPDSAGLTHWEGDNSIYRS
jgi:hypothetical protein